MSKLHKIVVLSAMLGFALTASAAMNNGKGTPVPNKQPVATQSNKVVTGKMKKADAKAVKHQKKVKKQKMKKHAKKNKKMKQAKKVK
ncbi:MAG: hypothetical protein KKA99_04895 [Gammaproteobacteria bacterium]|nr:hypothetical protein [Gammaproteobacteria bacterium]MBU1558792.1 hypothetical protein [Gammaproteobacteria bacterium]MBU2546404.1 hypothetical protein [Gammaproteobacteria bacterium]